MDFAQWEKLLVFLKNDHYCRKQQFSKVSDFKFLFKLFGEFNSKKIYDYSNPL